MLHLYAALAEKERRLMSARTKAALQAERASGAKLGNPSAAISRSIRDELIPLIEAIRKAGAFSLREIADALNCRGIRPA